jgi:YD repeat-containing protein
VDYVQIGDETAHAESRAVSYDKGAIDGREVYASDGNMFWNGALRLTQQYRYNSIGNLTHKEGATFGYGTQASSCAAGALNKPHALVNGLGTSNCYDAAGNMVSGGGRTISWNQEQMPLSVTAGGVTESYSYNGDSQRVTITRSGVTTIFVEGLYEEESTGKVRTYYTLNGHTVAVRETEGSTVTIRSLHSDHLGSISASTKRDASNNPAWASLQQFDPWGKVRLTAVQSPPYGTGEAPTTRPRAASPASASMRRG